MMMGLPSSYLWIVVVGGIASFITAFAIGANDVANTFSAAVGSRALPLWLAIVLAAILETLGATLLGSTVTENIKNNVIHFQSFEHYPGVLALGMLCASLGSGSWLVIASRLGMPVSTTHCIIGALLGFGLATGNLNAIRWKSVLFILVSWIVAPLSAAIVGMLIFLFVRTFVLRRRRPLSKGLWIMPVFMFLIGFSFSVFLVFKNPIEIQRTCIMNNKAGQTVLAHPCRLSGWADAHKGAAMGISLAMTVFFSLILSYGVYRLALVRIRNLSSSRNKVVVEGLLPDDIRITRSTSHGTMVACGAGPSSPMDEQPTSSIKQIPTTIDEESRRRRCGSDSSNTMMEVAMTPSSTITSPHNTFASRPEFQPTALHRLVQTRGNRTPDRRIPGELTELPEKAESDWSCQSLSSLESLESCSAFDNEEDLLNNQQGHHQVKETTEEGMDLNLVNSSKPLERSEPTEKSLGWKQRIRTRAQDQWNNMPWFKDLHAEACDETAEALQSRAETFDEKTETLFSCCQIVSSCLGCLAHSANDTANAIGPFAAILTIYQDGIEQDVSVSWYVLFCGGISMSFGLALMGYRVITTMGVRMVKITPPRGFCIELGAAWVVLVFSYLGIPLSTTHCAVGSTLGVGLSEPKREHLPFMEGLQRRPPVLPFINTAAVNWKLFGSVFVSWIGTVFFGCLVSMLFFSFAAYSPTMMPIP